MCTIKETKTERNKKNSVANRRSPGIDRSEPLLVLISYANSRKAAAAAAVDLLLQSLQID